MNWYDGAVPVDLEEEDFPQFLVKKDKVANFITHLFDRSIDLESVIQSIEDSQHTWFVVRPTEKMDVKDAEKLVSEFSE